jgi:hypothetical protein
MFVADTIEGYKEISHHPVSGHSFASPVRWPDELAQGLDHLPEGAPYDRKRCPKESADGRSTSGSFPRDAHRAFDEVI